MRIPIALMCVLGVVCVWAEKPQGSDRIVRQMRSATQYPDEATAAEIQTILDRHNHHRRQAGAANMEHMTWNAELAAKAVELSSTCRVEHDMLEWPGSPYPRVGQNLYLNTYPGYELAVDGWHDSEIGYYDFDSNTCSDVCGHYTQVVWDTSREVGCGRHYCELAYDDDGRQWNNVYVTTCNYGPPGNYDRQPFSMGPACTACESGSGICNDGLCDSDCTGSHCTCELSCGSHGSLNTAECTCSCDDGWFGTSCDQECDNYNPSCGANPGWPKSFCSVYDLVYQSCPLLCDRCVPAGGFVCEDTHEYCGANPG